MTITGMVLIQRGGLRSMHVKELYVCLLVELKCTTYIYRLMDTGTQYIDLAPISAPAAAGSRHHQQDVGDHGSRGGNLQSIPPVATLLMISWCVDGDDDLSVSAPI
jgi:hypothetical protein